METPESEHSGEPRTRSAIAMVRPPGILYASVGRWTADEIPGTIDTE
jgi:hypothetical protein